MENISFELVFDYIRNARFCIAFTGAGVSTLSGLKDFRGPDGLYKDADSDKIFALDYFMKDPSFYYTRTKGLIYQVDEIKPNLIHFQLARMEQMGILRGIITQNIDRLHQLAGSEIIWEIHGSGSIHHCMKCRKAMSYGEIDKIVGENEVPLCPVCGSVMKPDITFFGEGLPVRAWEESRKAAEKADIMLVLGSSLTVQPAASLPLYCLEHGGKLVIVNQQSTCLDNRAIACFTDLSDFFEKLEKQL